MIKGDRLLPSRRGREFILQRRNPRNESVTEEDSVLRGKCLLLWAVWLWSKRGNSSTRKVLICKAKEFGLYPLGDEEQMVPDWVF